MAADRNAEQAAGESGGWYRVHYYRGGLGFRAQLGKGRIVTWECTHPHPSWTDAFNCAQRTAKQQVGAEYREMRGV